MLPSRLNIGLSLGAQQRVGDGQADDYDTGTHQGQRILVRARGHHDQFTGNGGEGRQDH